MNQPPRISPRAGGGLTAVLGLAMLTAGCGQVARTQNAAGVQLFNQGDLAAAAQRFQEAAHADPHSSDAYYNLAAVYHRSGVLNRRPEDLRAAEQYYQWTLARDPNHRQANRGMAVLLADQGRSEEAFRLLESWAARSFQDPNPRIELARLSEEVGKPEVAKEQLAAALTLAPNDSRALAALGRLREQSGETALAAADYARSLQANRFQPEVARRLASLQTSGTQLAALPPASSATWGSGGAGYNAPSSSGFGAPAPAPRVVTLPPGPVR